MVLLGISPLISPDLLDVLMRAGHGDTIVLADAHFPAESICKRQPAIRLVRADGLRIPDLLKAMLPLFPVDTFVPESLMMMAVVEGDTTDTKPTLDAYKSAITAGCQGKPAPPVDVQDPSIKFLERFAFYEMVTSSAYCIVQTGETAKYGNIAIKKGVCY